MGDFPPQGPVPSDLEVRSVNTEELDNVYHASNVDGADGGVKIQNALDAADAAAGSNGVVIGPDGPDSPSSAPESDVWEVSSRIDPTGYDDMHIIGRGKPMLFLSDGAESDIIRAGLESSSPTTSNVTISGVRFHGNKANQTTFGKRDPDSDGTTEIKGLVGVRPINCDEWLVEDCTFENFERFGYCCKLAQGMMVVRDSRADNCDDDGFTVTNQFFDTQDPDSAKHIFDGVRADNNGDQGLEVEDGARNVLITNSHFEGNSQDNGSVKSHSGEQPCENVVWDNCTFVGAPRALALQSSYKGNPRNYQVQNCDVIGATTNGIAIGVTGGTQKLYDISITGTTVEMSGTNAAVRQDTSPIDGLTVDIDVNVESGTPAEALKINGGVNNLDATVDCDGSGSMQNGIVMRSRDGEVHDITISPKTNIRNCAGNGLRISHDGNVISHGQIYGTFKNNGQDTSKANLGRAGVAIFELSTGPATTDLTVSVQSYDDQSTATQTYGIHHADGNYNLYTDCNLRGVANSAFNGTAGTNSLKTDNII